MSDGLARLGVKDCKRNQRTLIHGEADWGSGQGPVEFDRLADCHSDHSFVSVPHECGYTVDTGFELGMCEKPVFAITRRALFTEVGTGDPAPNRTVAWIYDAEPPWFRIAAEVRIQTVTQLG